MDDSQIAELCRRIYQKHKLAIDLINEHSQRTRDDVYAYLVRLIKSDERFVLDDPIKTFLRFALLEWDVPGFQEASPRAWTSSRRQMIFEFVVDPDRLKLWLVVGPGKQEKRQVLIDSGKGGVAPFSANPSGNKNYTHLFVHDILTPTDFETFSFEDMTEQIDQLWRRFVEYELPVIVETMSPAIAELTAMASRNESPSV